MSEGKNIVVVGAGAWGTALATCWASADANVTLLARDFQSAEAIQASNTNEKYLPGIPLSQNLTTTANPDCLNTAQTVVFVVPTQTLNDTLQSSQGKMTNASDIILCSKGIDRNTGLSPYDMARASFPDACHGVLSGPSFAHDVAKGLPTAVTFAATNRQDAKRLAQDLSTRTLRIYASDDIAGVEAGGALKNVLALAVGAARGLNLGASAEAALITRAFRELQRLGTAMGGRAETLTGLSGFGDLVLTCSSPQSRNFAYGMKLAQGGDLTHTPLAEGVHTAHMAQAIARRHAIETPIIDVVVSVLDGTLLAQQAVAQLLSRPLKDE